MLTIGNIYCERVNPIFVEVNHALQVRPECLKNRGRGMLSLEAVYVAAGDFLLVLLVGGSKLNPDLRVPSYNAMSVVANVLIFQVSRAHNLLKTNVKARNIMVAYISALKELQFCSAYC